MKKIRSPFLIVNPKSYIYGQASFELAKICNQLSKKYDIDILFTGQHVDLREIISQNDSLFVCAQHMDFLTPGRGMGYVLADGLVDAGVWGVVLNHAEHPLLYSDLEKTIKRAREVGLNVIVCANSLNECQAVANLYPDIMICEPTSNIGLGQVSDDEYILSTTKAVKDINPNILVIQAAGVSCGDDVYKILEFGADASGGTSGILKADSPAAKIEEMLVSIKKYLQK